MIVGKVVDNTTRGHCILTGSVKSENDYFNIIHNTGVGTYIDLEKTNLVYLVG